MARNLTSVEDYHAMVAGAMAEEELLVAVETEATLGGWRWHHIRRADLAQQQGDPGWPDFIALRGDRVVVAELKAARGRVEPAQQAWLDAWSVAGAETHIWRPSDWEEIVRALR